jgi:WD40 repeat protein
MMVITKMCKVFPLVKSIKDEKEFNVYNEILKHKFICKACVSNNIPQKLLCVAFDNNTKLLFANTFDNSILIIDIKTIKIIQTIYINAIYHGNYHITALSLSKYEDRIVFATEIGSILLCNIKLNKKQLPHNAYSINVIKTVADHLNEVNNIELNTDMNVLISSDIDGYVNIYTLPNVKLIRSVKLNIIPYAQLLMVSSAYVPCVVCYCNSMFEVFTINGSYVDVEVEKEWTGKVRSYAVFSTMLNKQFLILGLMNGKVEIRELPELKMRRILQVIPGDKKEEIIGVLPVEQNSIYVYSRNNVFHIYNDIV